MSQRAAEALFGRLIMDDGQLSDEDRRRMRIRACRLALRAATDAGNETEAEPARPSSIGTSPSRSSAPGARSRVSTSAAA